MAVYEIEDLEEEKDEATEEKPEEKATPETEEEHPTEDTHEDDETPIEDQEEVEEEHVTEKKKPQRKKIEQWEFDKNYRLRKEAEREAEYWKTKALETKDVQPVKESQQPGKPKIENFESQEEFIDALTDWKITDREAKKKAQQLQEESAKKQQETVQVFNQKRDQLLAEDREFGEKGHIHHDLVPLMANLEPKAIKEIALYFGENAEDEFRIMNLPLIDAAREIGRLEAKLLNKPKKVPPKIKTNAPPPTKTVGSKQAGEVKLEDLSTEDFIAKRNKEVGYYD